MTAVEKVAIAGSGAAALAAASLLARSGVVVDVFEERAEVSGLGSGITLQGNSLRTLDALGVWDDARAQGFPFTGLTLRAPGPDAPVVADLPDVQTGGPDYPAGMGMYRPDLARILHEHALRAGARIRFGARVTGLTQTGDGVEVFIGEESAGVYDLLIGADGLNSTVRDLIGIETRPQPTGMGIWRTIVSRPADVERTELYYGGPMYIAGYTPTGPDSMYAFLVESAQDRQNVSDAEATQIMLAESMAYGGPWNSIRADLAAGSHVNYTWFTSHLVEGAWNRGRVVVIGDAAHSCPPTIAQGAAQALEDALVLSELLLASDTIDPSLWDAFHARRVPRAQAVVNASVQLGRWQLEGDRDADAPALIFATAQLMAQPA
jgi:2-polyprenyl-6-methoxyphenol hydroxylase-like FAD-dependent oxidoreductase